MKPVKFKGSNVVYGADQKEYQPLPGHRDETGTVTFCMELTEEEISEVNATGKVWISLLTFNHPLQPIRMTTSVPEQFKNSEDEQGN